MLEVGALVKFKSKEGLIKISYSGSFSFTKYRKEVG